ncbi:MAG: cytochrome c5 family protein [Candidatus Accumulibacter sp.]|nr:cytochrome c5 family protein [Accumulibacter sp.]
MSQGKNSSQAILMVTIVVAIVLTILIWQLASIGKGSTAATAGGDDADTRIQPVAKVELVKAAAKSDGKPRDGAAVYNAVCMACHATGAAGAPKAGDKAAWAPRIALGMSALIESAGKGKGAMPPKGGAADLSDTELKAAVEHLVGLSK